MAKKDALDAFMGNSTASLPYVKKVMDPADLRKTSKMQTFGRKAQGGPLKLRGLSQRHLEILALHLSGDYSNKQVGQIMGISLGKVNAVLDDPLAQNIITSHRNGQLMELEALMPKVTEAIRDTLGSKDEKVRLQAVDRFVKMSKQGFDDQLATGNLAITIVDARTRFVEQLRECIDITPDKPDARELTSPTKNVLAKSNSVTSTE